MRHQLVGAVGLGLILVNPHATAQPVVQEQVLGPLMDNFWAGYTIAPRGVRLASVSARGEGGVVTVDGVESPAFDELLDVRCVDVSLSPEQNDVKVLDQMREVLNRHRSANVIFSEDGARYAYGCGMGNEFVIIADGKELHRGPAEERGWIALRFSPRGRHVVFTTRPNQGDVAGFRLFVDGKPEQFSYLQPYPVFSPDGERYAYVVTDPKNPDRHTLIIDGQPAAYEGVRPRIDAKGRVFSVKVNADDGKQTLQLDGAPVFTAPQVKGVYPSPTGERYAAVGAMGRHEELFVDGQSAATASLIEEVVWSPDGAHFAVICQTAERTRYLVYDGQNGPEVDNVTDVTFAPDSSAMVYLGYFDGQNHVVLNNADIMQGAAAMPVKPFFFGPAGACKIAFVQGAGLHDLALVMDQQMLGGLNNLTGVTFSPDGTRFGFVHGPQGQGKPVLDEMEYADRIPAPFQVAAGTLAGSGPPVYFLFSPDSKHVAYLASSRQNGASGVIVDGTPIATSGTRVGRPHFTPDSQHLFWIEAEKPYFRIYLDGEPVAQYDMISSAWESNPAMWEMSPEGVFSIMGPSGDRVKRIRITPGPGTSIETMIAKAKAR